MSSRGRERSRPLFSWVCPQRTAADRARCARSAHVHLFEYPDPNADDLTWEDQSANETGFEIKRRIRNPDSSVTAWIALITTAANAEMYYDTGLTGGVTYQYRVRACNSSGCSSWNVSEIGLRF